MEFPVWLAYANFGLNLLIVPAFKMLWSIRVDLIQLKSSLSALTERVDLIDERHHELDAELRRR